MGQRLPGVLGLLPNPSIVIESSLKRTIQALPPGARVLDVGAGGRRIVPDAITVDVIAWPGVSVVGDVHRLPLADNTFDCAFCTGTFEHIRDPWQAVRELHRVLKPGGMLHVDAPFMQAFHLDPVDYWRFTVDGLRLLCKDFTEVDAGVHIGPSCSLYWSLREYMDSCLTSNKVLARLFLAGTAFLLAPIRYLDYWTRRQPESFKAASAFYYRGRKA